MKFSTRRFTSLFLLTLLVSVGSVSFVSAYQPYYSYSWCNLTVNTNLSGAGTVTPSSGSFYYGDYVVAREYTNPGYSFDGWYLNGVYQGKLSSIPITMYRDYTLLAVFSKRVVSLTITANPSDGGTLAPGTGVWNYTYGDAVTVKEFENADHPFSGWYLDGAYGGAGPSITVEMTQDHQLNAFFAGNSTDTATPAPEVTPAPIQQEPTPGMPIPELNFYCTSSTSLSGFNVQIEGTVAYNQIGLSGAGILLSYSVTGGATWQDLAYVKTLDDGSFTAVWMPSASGYYLIKATWPGDDVYTTANKIVSFVVAPAKDQNQDVFSVASNSSVSSLKVDTAQNELGFSVSGPSGTSGYVQVCVPKSLLPDATNMKVTLDGNSVAYQPISNGDVWLIIFTYHHSSHKVVMELNQSASSLDSISSVLGSPLVLVAIIAVLVAIIAVLLVRTRRRPKVYLQPASP